MCNGICHHLLTYIVQGTTLGIPFRYTPLDLYGTIVAVITVHVDSSQLEAGLHPSQYELSGSVTRFGKFGTFLNLYW